MSAAKFIKYSGLPRGVNVGGNNMLPIVANQALPTSRQFLLLT